MTELRDAVRMSAVMLRWYIGVTMSATVAAGAVIGIMEVVRPYAVR